MMRDIIAIIGFSSGFMAMAAVEKFVAYKK